MDIRFAHTNIISNDWRKLAQFYVEVFDCRLKLPERDLKGAWLDDLANLKQAHLQGVHVVLPGFGEDGPTLEIFQYAANTENLSRTINTEGFGHIAFAVSDVEGCLKRVLGKGGSMVGKVVLTTVDGVGALHVVYARDPEGNIIEIQKWD